MSFDKDTSPSYQSIIYKLHSSLKLTNFWPQYIEALAEELDLEIEELTNNSLLINDPTCELQDYLLELANKFGYTPNLIIDNSIFFIQQELKSIPYRIRKKSTYKGYKFNFKQISRVGEIYNLFYNQTKFVKAVNWDSIYNYIDVLTPSGYSLPFTNIAPDINYSTFSEAELIKLDTGRTLDENPVWTLDNSLSSTPSKHLGIEYYIDKLVTPSGELTEYSLYNDYFQYLEIGTEYNRRVPVFPHTGTNISTFIGNDGRYNSFGITTTSSYSIPDLKLSSGVTFPYLLTYSGGLNDTSKVVYASIGTGSKQLPNEDTIDLFNPDYMRLAYSFDDKDYSTYILDYSSFDITTTLSGTTTKIDSILGKSLNFNGNTYGIGYNYTTLNEDHSYFFWLNPSDYETASKNYGYIFEIPSLLYFVYDYQNTNLIINFQSSDIITSSLTPNEDHLIGIKINVTSSEINLSIDGILIDTQTISFYSETTSNLYIGIDNTLDTSLTYIGKLDSFLVTKQILSDTLLLSAYTKRIGIITSLNNFIYRVPVNNIENNIDNSNWFSTQTYLPSYSINDEYLFTLISGIDTYTGTLKYNNLREKYLNITYYTKVGVLPYGWTATDDGAGNILGDYISGTIDYDTGEYTIYPYTLTDVYQRALASSSVSSISQFLNYNIQTGTFYLYYTIADTSYVAMDNGSGSVIGTGISSGLLDYTTGQLDITFTQPTQSGYYTTCQYSYKTTLTLNPDTPYVFAEYKVNDDLDITEFCIEDEENKALAYVTFPPINFYSIYNYASFVTMIRQTTIS